MRLARLVLVVLVAVAAVHPPVAAQGLTFVLFERYLDALRQQGRIPGMSAAVVSGRRIVWERGFGQQDVEGAIAATPDTPYLVGDLTQPVSATLLLRCMESGTLRLDDPIGLFTGSGPDAGRTVHQVLTHASVAGVPSFKYDPATYATLSGVISACGGVTYPRALAHQLLDRLAMVDSVPGRDAGAPVVQFVDSERTARYLGVLARMAVPYRVDPSGRTVPADYPPTGLNAATGLISTVRDLARFDAAIDDDVLLRAGTRELAFTNAVSPSGARIPTGLGWFVQNYNGNRLVWHFGLLPDAFSSLILKVPDRDLTLILLANSDGLSRSFRLADGDVTASLFAKLFLRLFV